MSTFTNFRWSDARHSSAEPYRVRATKSIETINWAALNDVAASYRSVGCTLGQQYGFGGRHVVREIVFDDNIRWIARVGIPPINHNEDEKYEPKPIHETFTAEKEREMQSEIATMAYVRQNTSVSVPEVFSYDCTTDNAVGAPYMLMELILGAAVVDFRDDHQIPEKYKEKFMIEEASISVRTPQAPD